MAVPVAPKSHHTNRYQRSASKTQHLIKNPNGTRHAGQNKLNHFAKFDSNERQLLWNEALSIGHFFK